MTAANELEKLDFPDVRYSPRRLGHVNLFVSDFLDELNFLTGVCGFEETGRESKVRSGFVSNGNTHHDIGFIDIPGWQAHSSSRILEGPAWRGKGPMLNHLGLEMNNEAELVDAYKRAIAAGMTPRITHNGTSKSNYIFDPWGMQYQLYADETLEWRKVFTGGEAEFHANPPWNPLEGVASTEPFWDPNPQIRRVESAALHPVKVSHIVLDVENVDPHRQFYVRILGLNEVAGDGDEISYLAGQTGDYFIVLVRSDSESVPRMHHSSFELSADEDLDVAAKELERRNISVVRRVEASHKSSLYINDPSGLLFEFFIRHSATPEPASDVSPQERAFLA